jgi:heat shock protein HslJ
MTSIVVASILSLAVLAGAGCSTASRTDDSKSLEGKVWKATEISGVAAVLPGKGSQATAEFSSGKMTGSGTVNRYTAAYTTQSGNKIAISQPAATLMAGPPAAMTQEQAYFSAITKAAKFAVSGDSLTLTDGQGATLVKYVAVQPTTLTGTEWDALAYNNGRGGLQSLAASSAITANFGTDGSLTGNAGVNRYTGKYTTSGKDQMTIDPQIATTMMAAADEAVAQQEAAYLAALPKTATYTIEGDELWLRDAGGAALAHYVAK